jgi:hypothetical protein
LRHGWSGGDDARSSRRSTGSIESCEWSTRASGRCIPVLCQSFCNANVSILLLADWLKDNLPRAASAALHLPR